MTINELATECLTYLKRSKNRKEPGIGAVLLADTDKRPDWFQDMCRAAHGDMMPDDWRYEFIGDALNAISECDSDDQDEIREFWEQSFDGSYVYTYQQTAWLASRADRYGYCDEAAREYGMENCETMQRIALGMLYEGREVFESILSSLIEELKTREAA